MIRFFRSGNPLTVLLLLIYTIFVKFYYFLHPVTYLKDGGEGLLYNLVVGWIDSFAYKNALFYTFLTVVLLFLQALLFTKLINQHRLFSRSTYLPGMCYILFSSMYQGWNQFSPAILINLVMLWVFSNVPNLYNRSSARDVAFNLGFAVGVCSLIYFPSVIFVLLLFMGLVAMRSFRLAEWILALLGLACPLYILGTYLFLTDQWALTGQLTRIGINIPMIHDYKVWGALIANVLFFITGWIIIQRSFNKMLIQTRKIWNVWAFYAFIAMLIPFFTATFSANYWILAVLPISMFAGNVFWSIQNNTFANAIHILLLLYVIVMQYFSQS
ncbi:hypothetical protein COR50_08065 [Chitinophaga caeni]|uniref:Beta-carotene 15,15'-monooxygenase n=1 Tax=Chitinophaga caeni TaxID=2029983 RepID=A0A291QTD9_9BACT|nr:DUF6427 family protein [Chitinophaga caeni]ATL47142.1 hypothetical protein COR50_08065 [Chitinophaga caeni]